MRKYLIIIGCYLAYCVIAATASSAAGNDQKTVPPLDMDRLRNELSFVRGKAKAVGAWPRKYAIPLKFMILRLMHSSRKQKPL